MSDHNSDSIILSALQQRNGEVVNAMGGDVLLIRAPMSFGLDDKVKDVIESIKSAGEDANSSHDKVVVIVEKNGGYIEIVERIVNVLRRHYSLAEFVIPNFCYSAGTVLVLSGDEIWMNYYSVLGPIDPQFESENGDTVPGMGYLAKFRELTEEINSAGPNESVQAQLFYLAKKFDLARLFHIEQAIEHSKTLIMEWLPQYKFKDWQKTQGRGAPVDDDYKAQRAQKIAEVLGDAEKWHSHGRGIAMSDLIGEDIKLKIKDFSAVPKINSAIVSYHGLFCDYMARTGMRAAIHSLRGLRSV